MSFIDRFFRRNGGQENERPATQSHAPVRQRGDIQSLYQRQVRKNLKLQLDRLYEDGKAMDISKFLSFLQRRDLTKGQNIEGEFNQHLGAVGMAIYYDLEQPANTQKYICKGYLGQVVDDKRIGKGIQLTIVVNKQQFETNPNVLIESLKSTTLTMYVFENWEQTAQRPGNYVYERNKQRIVYIGSFEALSFRRGQLRIFRNNQIEIEYRGPFENNEFEGEGQLIYKGNISYKGEFKSNCRHGIGKEKNKQRKTRYYGEFAHNKKNGYGELTYLSKNNIKLKCFWKDDFIIPQEGVYVEATGEVRQLASEHQDD